MTVIGYKRRSRKSLELDEVTVPDAKVTGAWRTPANDIMQAKQFIKEVPLEPELPVLIVQDVNNLFQPSVGSFTPDRTRRRSLSTPQASEAFDGLNLALPLPRPRAVSVRETSPPTERTDVLRMRYNSIATLEPLTLPGLQPLHDLELMSIPPSSTP